jgi:hypothetical protein
MKATLRISLYNYFYLKLAKTLCLSYYLLCFLFNKIREQESRIGSAWKGGWGEGGGRWLKHVSKCKNYKIKKIRKISEKESSQIYTHTVDTALSVNILNYFGVFAMINESILIQLLSIKKEFYLIVIFILSLKQYQLLLSAKEKMEI